MSRLIHLNGPPGIGKSTVARRYVAEHATVLNCDIDLLRTLIGGWSADFGAAGELIRPSALAMIRAHLASGHDVVLPQMLVDLEELALFEACATETGAEFIEVFLMDERESAVARFNRRSRSVPADPWLAQVRTIVSARGGDQALAEWHTALEQLSAQRHHARVIPSAEGDLDETYQRLLVALD